MTQQLVSLIEQYGLFIVVGNVLLDQIGLPVPAVPTLMVAGAIGSGGRLPLGEVFLFSVLACLLADCCWYLVGQIYGIRVLKILCRISLEPDSCVSETQTRFERWGVNALLIAKFVPGLAIIAPPMAGAMRIGWTKFVALSSAGSVLWVAVALGLGMLFESQIERLVAHLNHIGSIAGVAIAVLLVGYIAFKWWERRRFFRTLRMARISVSELYDLIQAGAAPVIVDVRSPTGRALEPRWIPGAVHVPLKAVSEHIRELPRDRDIILYCTCPNEASAARVAQILVNNGFKKVRPLHGGLDAWIAAGYAVATDAQPPGGTA